MKQYVKYFTGEDVTDVAEEINKYLQLHPNDFIHNMTMIENPKYVFKTRVLVCFVKEK